MSEVGLETAEDDWGLRAEVEDLGIPLGRKSIMAVLLAGKESQHTLSTTFSSELGQSMAKQTNSRSVSG